MATVVTSKFTPFTFEELLKPALLATQAHYEMEDAYTELATKANVWESLANSEQDKDVYNMYKAYADDLKKQADILASQGLNANSRKALSQMKSRYSSEIDPIEKASKKREELINQQKEALLRDDTLMFDKDYSTTSLNYLMKNPNATFTSLSGESIAKRTAAMAKEAASAILSDPEYKSVFNSQYVQQKIMQGYDMSQVIAAAQRDPNAPKALLGIIDAIKGQVGYDKWNGDNQKKIDSYINEGLEAAIGTPKIDIMSNRNFKSDMDIERMKLAREQFEYETKGIKQPDGSYYKPLGGGRTLHTKPDGTSTIIGVTPEDNKEDKDKQNKLQEALNKATTRKELRALGYIPKVAIIRGNDGWMYGREGEDIEGAGVWPNTNLRSSWWGNIGYSYDNDTQISVVNDNKDIPGYLQYESGQPYADTAFGKLLEAAIASDLIVYKTDRNGNILKDEKGRPEIDESNSRFFTENTQVVRVKAPRPNSRAKMGMGEEYDYLIYTR